MPWLIDLRRVAPWSNLQTKLWRFQSDTIHNASSGAIKLFLTQSTDNHHCGRVRSRLCPFFGKHECCGGGFTDAHMSSSDGILALLKAEEDVAVRRGKRRTTRRTGGRRVWVEDTLPNVFAGGILPWS